MSVFKIKLWSFFVGLLGIFLGFMGMKFKMYDFVFLLEWSILKMNSMDIEGILLFDWVSLIFMGLVLMISSMVILYSNSYLSGDNNLLRFILLIILFVFSMLLLIVSPNLISILLGWDGLGLISYCLVIYYQNVSSFNAGSLTILINRVGDISLILAGAWMLNYGGWNLSFYLSGVNYSDGGVFLSGLIMIASLTKSAQFPFSSWLPAAMAAPTPVSSLVHSSTLVTAGVYLMIRFSDVYYLSGVTDELILISSITMFMAGLGANFEYDLKKIIALSTLSQLGLMVSIFCLGFVDLTFFHLIIHAVFKAMLFMSAGILIHNLGHQQDIRYMGGVFNYMPLLSICFNVANMSLCGFLFLSGFYSKDMILESVMCSLYNLLIYVMFFFSMLFTVMYTFRLFYYSMLGGVNLLGIGGLDMSGNSQMMKSMLGMVLFVIFGGSSVSWMIFSCPYMICLPLFMKLIPLGLILMGGIGGYFLFYLNISIKIIKADIYYLITYFLGGMWFMPILSTMGLIKYPLGIGSYLVKNMDQGWSEWLGGKMIYSSFIKISKINEWIQCNLFSVYLFIFYVFCVVNFIFIF
uniref:NADH dehydrogenase subunit 5 n=1 Tax=Blasticotoma filiceti TaxID=1141352 RepID=UPI0022051BE8|nr:NADH dehydrogenase subunit 5 [Blasticotoma filiceti]UXW93445.1 NADH dehydrogenase subunit 5 [Blasticotoma filiceti]